MQHFFADPSCVDGEQIRLAGSDVNHMKNVLRMKSGEEVWVSDGEGMDYFCSVEGYEEKEAVLRVVKKEVSQTELASRDFRPICCSEGRGTGGCSRFQRFRKKSSGTCDFGNSAL